MSSFAEAMLLEALRDAVPGLVVVLLDRVERLALDADEERSDIVASEW